MIKNDFKIAVRNLFRDKGFSTINILGLAIGMTCCMLISIYVFNELSFDKHHQDANQLYQVGTVFVRPDGDQKTGATPFPLGEALKLEYPEVESYTKLVGLFVDDKTVFKIGDKTFYESNGYLADDKFFKLFKYDFIEGSPQSALSQLNTIVISDKIACSIFGNQSALDKIIHIESNTNGSADYKVTGVFQSDLYNSHIDGNFFIRFEGGGLDEYISREGNMASNNMFFTYLKLAKGANAKLLESKFDAFIEKYMRKDLTAMSMDKKQFLTKVQDIHLFTDLQHNVTPTGSLKNIYILLSIAFFILLIACINFMNLSTSKSFKRAKEVGVRKVLGAQKFSLVKHFLIESIFLSTIAFLVSIFLLFLFMPVFQNFSGKIMSFNLMSKFYLASGFLFLSITTGLMAGIYPAFYLTAFKPIMVLKGKFVNSLSAVNVRRSLVVFQFTLSIILIVSTFVINKQMSFLKNVDLGFSDIQQLVIPLRSENSKGNVVHLANSLENLSSVKSVTHSAYYPGIFNPEDANYFGNDQEESQARRARVNRVDFNYLNTLGIKLIAGRQFIKDSPADLSKVIINREAARQAGYSTPENAIGKNYIANRQHEKSIYEIIGVVEDFHFEDLHFALSPFVFQLNNGSSNYVIARIGSNDISSAISEIQKVWQSEIKSDPFEYTFLDEEFQKNYIADQKLASIIRFFTLIAIFISCLGLLGLSSYNAEQRMKELGIRKILGAPIENLIYTMSKEYVQLIFVAILLSAPIAYLVMQKWLQEFQYGIKMDIRFVLYAGMAALTVAFLTIFYHILKVSLVSPVKSLRSE